MEGTRDLKVASPGQVRILTLPIMPVCPWPRSLCSWSPHLYNRPVRPVWNEATWMERAQPVPSTGAASKKCKSLRSGKQVDSPGPCVHSHHPPQLACPGGSSSWHWPLGTAARRPRERNRDRLWHRWDDQLAPHPCYFLIPPYTQGPRRPCSPEVFRPHWGSRSQSNLDRKRQVTELQPQLPLRLSE